MIVTPCPFYDRRRASTRTPVPLDCPRCGGTLSTFSLSDATAVACDDCGYVGVEADHSGEPTFAESWADAFARFQEDND